MSIIEFLSQPFWQRLSLTLIHFIWQGLTIAALISICIRVFKPDRGNARYTVYLLAFAAMVVCPIVTFIAIDIPIRPDVEVVIEAETKAESAEFFDIAYDTILLEDAVLPEAETSVPVIPTLTPVTDTTPIHENVYSYMKNTMPWLLIIWMVGVIIFSIRLLMGFFGVHRWRNHLEPLPEKLVQHISSLSEQLGMSGFTRVLISPSVLQAMAVGYLRPMVLLPSSLVMQMPSEMLEAVIAHELAHIRRFDLWVNLAQRVTEALLFYHPAVWWLSGCLRSEREICCDELAVRATGERLTYASALESIVRAKFIAKQPVLAQGLSQNNKPILQRVRHILGLAPAQQNSSFWPAGVISVLFFVGLSIPATLSLNSIQAAVNTLSAKASNPTVLELLDKHKETREKLTTSFIAKSETFVITDYVPKSGSGAELRHDENYSKSEFRYDSNQTNMRRSTWGDVGSRVDVPEDDPIYTSNYNLTEKYIAYNEGDLTYTGRVDTGLVRVNERIPGRNLVSNDVPTAYRGHETFGYMSGDLKNIDEILRNPAYDVSVREKTEEIGGSQCYVIDADTNRGKYTLWIDPDHGYNLARAEVFREEGDLRGPFQDRNMNEGEQFINVLENVKFEQIDGVWIAVEADIEVVIDPLREFRYSEDIQFKLKEFRYSEDIQYKLTDFIMNPDHEALRSFEPDEIPNGAPVIYFDASARGISCTWHNGKVIDSLGREVNREYLESQSLITKTPISLAGKPLPSLTEFNINLNPELTDNRKLLICFWDVNQRPSRNCILTLNGQAQELLEKDIYMVFVQAEPADEQTITSWLKENEIQASAGTSKAGISELQYTWGLQALPWLILTNKEHIVITEGFSINELDEKIDEAINNR